MKHKIMMEKKAPKHMPEVMKMMQIFPEVLIYQLPEMALVSKLWR